jgi:large subunit ribosomal protein L25
MKIEVTAYPRTQQGSGASRRLRVTGRVPGIVYGADQPAQDVELDHKDLLFQLKREAFHSTILELAMNGEKFQVLLRDYQMHPWKQQVQHVDFQRVASNRKIHMKVPLHFLNAEICPGVKTGGGVAQPTMNDLEIQCLPDDLPAYIEVDLKDMELNETLHVNELAMPNGVAPISKLKHDNPAVVSVHVPKEIVIEEAAAAAPVTEIIGEVKAEGEAGAEGAAAEGEKKEAAAGDKKEPAAADKKDKAADKKDKAVDKKDKGADKKDKVTGK